VSLGLVYHDVGATAPRPLWGVLVEVATGRIWSPSLRDFVFEPPDPYLALSALACPGVDFGGAHRLWVADVTPPWDDSEYYLSIHASRPGPAIDRLRVPAASYVGFSARAAVQ
jgi:hypothetical protein